MARPSPGTQASDAEIPAVADWSREGRRWNKWALFGCYLVYASNGNEGTDLVKLRLNDVLFLESPQYPDQTVAKSSRHKPCDAPCGTFPRKTREWPSRLKDWMWRRRSRWQGIGQAPSSNKELKRLGGKKDEDVLFPSQSILTSKTTVASFRNSNADEGFLAKDPALVEEDDRFKDARKRALAFEWSNDARSRQSP
ncbi:hypothetical protein GWK47_043891 [Chionoecetes opilio]|uniref:Uncharacterized protein n=1 Tax=Chionoecetes opilio TaxID=41210 RepID=A0A8J4Y8Y3_CHIOP|nr:hypothetical protein GWK47_043891 [Chionoecetes opilio]